MKNRAFTAALIGCLLAVGATAKDRPKVEFLDSGETLTLVPGTVGRLRLGQRTRWTVEETLRKVYLS